MKLLPCLVCVALCAGLAFPAGAAAAGVDCLALHDQGIDWAGKEARPLPGVARIAADHIVTVEELAAGISAAAAPVTIIAGGNFGGQDMSLLGGAHENLCFVGTDLEQTGWSGASLPGSAFIRTNLAGAHFAEADLPRVLLLDATIRDTDMRRANLEGGLFAVELDSRAERWNLAGARLAGFRWECGITGGDDCPPGGS